MAAAAAALAASAATRAVADPGAAPESMPGPGWWTVAGWCAAAAVALLAFARVPWFRRLPRTGPAWPLRAEASVLAFAATFLAAAAAGAVAVALAGGPDAPQSLRAQAVQSIGARLAQVAAVAVAFAVPGLRTRGAGSVAGRGGIHAQPCGIAESILMAIAFAALLWPVAQAAGALAGIAGSWAGGPNPPVGHATLEALGASGPSDPWWWLTVAGAALLAPVAEELCFRGLLQQGLKATGVPPRAAVAVATALFVVVHLPVLVPGARASAVATLAVLSAGWGILYERTGRIAAPVIAHAAFNAANLAIASAA